jgi:hypothetical protein
MMTSFPLSSVSSDGIGSQFSATAEPSDPDPETTDTAPEVEPLLAPTAASARAASRERSFWQKLFIKQQRQLPPSQMYTIISMSGVWPFVAAQTT